MGRTEKYLGGKIYKLSGDLDFAASMKDDPAMIQ